MFDPVYQFLERIGYPHPIHPSETHIPIGLVVGAFFFVWGALFFRRSRLALTAWHCLILAFIFVFPTMILGFMDWQHYFAGVWLFPIKMKFTLACFLLVLLFTAIVLGNKFGTNSKSALTFYTLSFLTVVFIGYFGGQLVYSGWTPAATKEYQAGEKIFKSRCSGCHPHGGNIIDSNLPLRGAPQLKDTETFVAFIRNPKRPDGSSGIMPPFPELKVSQQQAMELYQYTLHVLENPRMKYLGGK